MKEINRVGGLSSISVLTPSYRYAQFIGDAINSVGAQGMELYVEHVVVDGASEDGTPDVLDRYPAVTWVSEPDKGQSDALNKAFHLAQGEFIGWLNADEFYLKDALKLVVDAFERTGADVVYGDAIHVDEDGRLIRLASQHRFDPLVLRYYGCYVPSCSFFVRRSALDDQPWNVDCKYVMDWDLYLGLQQAGAKFVYLARPLGAFRVHGSQVTAQPLARDAPERIRVQDSHEIRRSGMVAVLLRRSARLKRVARKLISGAYARERRLALMVGVDTRWWGDTDEVR